jgi:hypothetical protein
MIFVDINTLFYIFHIRNIFKKAPIGAIFRLMGVQNTYLNSPDLDSYTSP